MGTTYSVVLYGDQHDRMAEAVDGAFAELHRLDGLLSPYRPASAWSEINRLAAQGPVAVSPEVFNLISRCLRYSRQSLGTFDITVGPLLRTWGFYKGAGRLPSREDVTAAVARVGYRHVRLDPARRTVRFDMQGLEIDPGGIGKGYAVDRIVEILRQRGFDAALVMASSSSIYGMGAPPGEARGWRVDICDPKRPRQPAAEVFLKNMSLSTSGAFPRALWADGQIFSHIMDPRTGYPAQGMLSVSVVARHAIDSEAWTKPLFILGRSWAEKNRPRLRAYFCEERPGHTKEGLALALSATLPATKGRVQVECPSAGDSGRRMR